MVKEFEAGEEKEISTEIEHVSVFEENVRYWMAQGLNYTAAKNKAIDYHRRYTSREVTSNWQEMADTFESTEATPEHRVIFNQTVRKLKLALDDKHFLLVSLYLRKEGLEDFLNDENLESVQAVAGDKYPSSIAEIGEAMGFTVNKEQTTCATVYDYLNRVRKTARGLGLTISIGKEK